MTPELETHQSSNGDWGFRLRSSDGRILASGEGYPSREDMNRGIEEARTVMRAMKVESVEADGGSAEEDLRAAD